MNITNASQALFTAYAKDAGNWCGTPLVGGNVGQAKADCGNLTDLKKNGLLTTFEHDGWMWVEFTPAGIAYAAELGIDLNQ